LTADLWQAFAEAGITEVDVFFPERDDIGLVLSRTLDKDSIPLFQGSLIEIYRKLRPGDHQRSKPPRIFSVACSSIRASTISAASAA